MLLLQFWLDVNSLVLYLYSASDNKVESKSKSNKKKEVFCVWQNKPTCFWHEKINKSQLKKALTRWLKPPLCNSLTSLLVWSLDPRTLLSHLQGSTTHTATYLPTRPQAVGRPLLECSWGITNPHFHSTQWYGKCCLLSIIWIHLNLSVATSYLKVLARPALEKVMRFLLDQDCWGCPSSASLP